MWPAFLLGWSDVGVWSRSMPGFLTTLCAMGTGGNTVQQQRAQLQPATDELFAFVISQESCPLDICLILRCLCVCACVQKRYFNTHWGRFCSQGCTQFFLLLLLLFSRKNQDVLHSSRLFWSLSSSLLSSLSCSPPNRAESSDGDDNDDNDVGPLLSLPTWFSLQLSVCIHMSTALGLKSALSPSTSGFASGMRASEAGFRLCFHYTEIQHSRAEGQWEGHNRRTWWMLE